MSPARIAPLSVPAALLLILLFCLRELRALRKRPLCPTCDAGDLSCPDCGIGLHPAPWWR